MKIAMYRKECRVLRFQFSPLLFVYAWKRFVQKLNFRIYFFILFYQTQSLAKCSNCTRGFKLFVSIRIALILYFHLFLYSISFTPSLTKFFFLYCTHLCRIFLQHSHFSHLTATINELVRYECWVLLVKWSDGYKSWYECIQICISMCVCVSVYGST